MPFAWSEFAQLADRLQEDTNYTTEARRRTSASRFYYAAHWAVRSSLPPGQLEQARRHHKALGIHELVIVLCRDNAEARMRAIGDILDLLRENRVSADYRSHVDFGTTEIYAAKRLYNNISGALAALRTGPR